VGWVSLKPAPYTPNRYSLRPGDVAHEDRESKDKRECLAHGGLLGNRAMLTVAGQAGARKAGGTPPESLQVQNRNAAAASGGTKLSPNKQRFDPYKNFKFR
jgi:hypothetical protein